MKGSQHPANEVTINPSSNESILDVIDRIDVSRRTVVKTGVGAGALAAVGGLTMGGIVRTVEAAPPAAGTGVAPITFVPVPADTSPTANDRVVVPAGYSVQVLAAWGDPVAPGAPEWLEDASQDARTQAKQFGMHNDGMHFFTFPPFQDAGADHPVFGLLCVNHEYTHESILHPRGFDAAVTTDPGYSGLPGETVTIGKVRKSQAAHGVSVLMLRRRFGRRGSGGTWAPVRHSPFNRRITANTRMIVSGPAAGHPLLQARKYEIRWDGSFDTGERLDGRTAFGTANNCAHGYTPWGTYLTCEENWNGYFAAPTSGVAIAPDFEDQKAEILSGSSRYGISGSGFGYAWHRVDERFDADRNPLEPNLFGWVVEIDPFDPRSRPVKRTALGRFKHESAQVAVSDGNRVAFYMGDDERNEYVYKFVCSRPMNPRDRHANRDLLDHGSLYVARFTDAAVPGRPRTYRGEWIPLVPGTVTVIDDPNVAGRKLRLRELDLFKDVDDAAVQARICIQTRQAADAVGATMMDRPEWIALRTFFDPKAKDRGYPLYDAKRPLELYCTLTNNNRRGGGGSSAGTSVNSPLGTTSAGTARPPVDVANPRPDNDYGHIIRWREDGNVVTATRFEWDIFVLCGDSKTAKSLGATYQNFNLVAGTPAPGAAYAGDIEDSPPGSADFGAPDGLWFDDYGRLWVQTDQIGDASGDWVNIGGNVMVCADPVTKQVRRFMTSPNRCEVTGVVMSPDGRAMFVGIQHPGEDSPAGNPAQFSNWPQRQFATNSAGDPLPNTPGVRRPRSAVLVITKDDGGLIGT